MSYNPLIIILLLNIIIAMATNIEPCSKKIIALIILLIQKIQYLILNFIAILIQNELC